MPITVQHQPAAALIGQAAQRAGTAAWEEQRRREQLALELQAREAADRQRLALQQFYAQGALHTSEQTFRDEQARLAQQDALSRLSFQEDVAMRQLRTRRRYALEDMERQRLAAAQNHWWNLVRAQLDNLAPGERNRVFGLLESMTQVEGDPRYSAQERAALVGQIKQKVEAALQQARGPRRPTASEWQQQNMAPIKTPDEAIAGWLMNDGKTWRIVSNPALDAHTAQVNAWKQQVSAMEKQYTADLGAYQAALDRRENARNALANYLANMAKAGQKPDDSIVQGYKDVIEAEIPPRPEPPTYPPAPVFGQQAEPPAPPAAPAAPPAAPGPPPVPPPTSQPAAPAAPQVPTATPPTTQPTVQPTGTTTQPAAPTQGTPAGPESRNPRPTLDDFSRAMRTMGPDADQRDIDSALLYKAPEKDKVPLMWISTAIAQRIPLKNWPQRTLQAVAKLSPESRQRVAEVMWAIGILTEDDPVDAGRNY